MYPATHTASVSTMAIHRSRAASVSYQLRMSPEQRVELARVAAEHGMTVREWCLYRVLDVTEIEYGTPGRKKPQAELQPPLPEELRMTG